MTSWMILGAFFGGVAAYLFGFWNGVRTAARKPAKCTVHRCARTGR